jgi:hypothetical protein
LIIPNTYGVPVAFLGVPSTALLAAVEPALELLLAAAGLLLAAAELLLLLELLEPQPAANIPIAAMAAIEPSHLWRLMFRLTLLVRCW